MNTEACRAEYLKIARKVVGAPGFPRNMAEFNVAAREVLVARKMKEAPANFVEAAREIEVEYDEACN